MQYNDTNVNRKPGQRTGRGTIERRSAFGTKAGNKQVEFKLNGNFEDGKSELTLKHSDPHFQL